MTSEMNTVHGVIRATDSGFAEIEIEQGGCGRCHEEGGCGGQNLTQMFCSTPKHYRVENNIGALVGERVRIAISDGSVRQTANLMYGIPLLGTIVGAVLGAAVAADSGAILGCLLGLGSAFVYVRLRTRQLDGKLAARPYIVSRV